MLLEEIMAESPLDNLTTDAVKALNYSLGKFNKDTNRLNMHPDYTMPSAGDDEFDETAANNAVKSDHQHGDLFSVFEQTQNLFAVTEESDKKEQQEFTGFGVPPQRLVTPDDFFAKTPSGTVGMMSNKRIESANSSLFESVQFPEDVETPQEKIVSNWASQAKRSLTPSVKRALAQSLQLNPILQGDDLDKIILGWDLRGEHNIMEAKNVLNSQQELLNTMITTKKEIDQKMHGLVDAVRAMITLINSKQGGSLGATFPAGGNVSSSTKVPQKVDSIASSSQIKSQQSTFNVPTRGTLPSSSLVPRQGKSAAGGITQTLSQVSTPAASSKSTQFDPVKALPKTAKSLISVVGQPESWYKSTFMGVKPVDVINRALTLIDDSLWSMADTVEGRKQIMEILRQMHNLMYPSK